MLRVQRRIFPIIGLSQRKGKTLANTLHTRRCSSAVGFVNYDHEKKYFKLDIPSSYNFCRDCIDVYAGKDTNNTHRAFWWVGHSGEEEIWSYSQLSSKSKRAANVLAACEVGYRDRVVVILPKVPEWWLLNLACIRTGSVLMPGTTLLTAKDICHRLQKSKASCIVTDSATATKVADQCPDLVTKICTGPEATVSKSWVSFQDIYDSVTASHDCVDTRHDDPLQIFFTSGTTGLPKMAEHVHSYALAHSITARYFMDLCSTDVHWNVSDTGWAKSAWSYLFVPWLQGACVFVHNTPRFDPTETLETLQRYPVTTFCAAPTSYRLMVQQDLCRYSFPSLRHCMSAGEPLNPEVVESWRAATGVSVREGYGQSETILLSAASRCLPLKPGTMGKPPPGLDVQVIDEHGQLLPAGQEGDLALRVTTPLPPGFFTGYVDEPDRTAAAMRGEFYVTGDRAFMDDDGYLTFVGRDDDVINSSGYRIGPFEVESALIEHPAVSESAVVSSPDHTRGSVVKAYIILTERYKSADKPSLVAEIQEHVKKTTAPYKYPRKVEFVESLPKTVSGKIRRVELRQREWETQQA